MAVEWSQGWGFEYYSPSGDVNQALATRDAAGNITITDYARQTLTTTELVALMKDLDLAGPVQAAPPPAEDTGPKLTDVGQAAQDALNMIGAGGDRAEIVAELYRRAMQARRDGKADVANMLEAIAFNYEHAAEFANSDTQGIAFLRRVQMDLNAGKYTVGGQSALEKPVEPDPSAPTKSIGSIPSGTGVNNAGRNPSPLDMAPQSRRNREPVARPEVSRPSIHSGEMGARLRRARNDSIVARYWPELVALKETLESLNGATVYVNQVQVDRYRGDEFLNGRR